MFRKIISIFLITIFMFVITSCNGGEEPPVDPNGTIIEDDNNNNNNNNDNNNNDNNNQTPSGEVEFTVSLVYNKKQYIPKDGEVITVVWSDDYARYTKEIDSSGFAKYNLDGEFRVYLEGQLEEYIYNPNIYVVDNDSPTVEIELYKVAKISKGTGAGLYNEYQITSEGAYRAKLTTGKKKIYYEYQPKQAGWYMIESYVNIYDDLINPKLDIYEGTFAYKNFSETKDSGGASVKGGYTKNFKWLVNISDQRIGNVFTFVVYADSKTGLYPMTVDFRITYEGEYYEDGIVSKVIEAKEAKYKTPNYDKATYTFVNTDGGTGSYYGGTTNGKGIIDGSNYNYNPETGYWHVYDKTTDTFGPILCAKITQPCAYYPEDGALSMIESHGNKNLTVSNGTENYKQFVEVDYAATCNSDGVCYVTNELMEFLQKFSISQRLFFDGNGFVETTGVFALEQDQWLFACGYYVEKN